jgi:tRNA threonylcarbamoyladenosine biosynthesis protein TsaE
MARCDSAAATEELGRSLAEELAPGDLVLLEGDLAAGKTTLVRGLLGGLGGDPAEVSSPSFVLLQTYPCRRGRISALHHVDLYRLGDGLAELRELGLEELLSDGAAVVAVEWPKAALAAWIPAAARTWRVEISTNDDDSRSVRIHPPHEPGGLNSESWILNSRPTRGGAGG